MSLWGWWKRESMAGMNEQKLGRVIPWVAALFIGIASEFFPILGMLAAALVFPQGIHSDHAYAYLALAMSLNFAIFFTSTFYVFRFFIRRSYRTTSK
jgi:hypothetical protein